MNGRVAKNERIAKKYDIFAQSLFLLPFNLSKCIIVIIVQWKKSPKVQFFQPSIYFFLRHYFLFLFPACLFLFEIMPISGYVFGMKLISNNDLDQIVTFVMGHPVICTTQWKQLNKNTLKTTIIWSWFDTETREVFIVLTSTHLIYEFSSKMDASLKFIHRPPSYFGTSIELATPTIMTSDYYFIVGGLTRRPTSNG